MRERGNAAGGINQGEGEKPWGFGCGQLRQDHFEQPCRVIVDHAIGKLMLNQQMVSNHRAQTQERL